MDCSISAQAVEAEDEREPEFDLEALEKIFPAKKSADPEPVGANESEEDDGVEQVGAGLREDDIRAWACFSCGEPLTRAHAGDYFHTDPSSKCTDAIPVPMSLVQLAQGQNAS